MAALHTASIGKVDTVAPGATVEFRWNNPPSHKMLHYFAFPIRLTCRGSTGRRRGPWK